MQCAVDIGNRRVHASGATLLSLLGVLLSLLASPLLLSCVRRRLQTVPKSSLPCQLRLGASTCARDFFFCDWCELWEVRSWTVWVVCVVCVSQVTNGRHECPVPARPQGRSPGGRTVPKKEEGRTFRDAAQRTFRAGSAPLVWASAVRAALVEPWRAYGYRAHLAYSYRAFTAYVFPNDHRPLKLVRPPAAAPAPTSARSTLRLHCHEPESFQACRSPFRDRTNKAPSVEYEGNLR
jgi:hypothetical protein